MSLDSSGLAYRPTMSHVFDDVKVVVRMLKRRDQLLKSSCALLVQLRQLLLDTGDVTRAVLLLRADMDLADKATFKAQTKRWQKMYDIPVLFF